MTLIERTIFMLLIKKKEQVSGFLTINIYIYVMICWLIVVLAHLPKKQEVERASAANKNYYNLTTESSENVKRLIRNNQAPNVRITTKDMNLTE